MMYQQIYKAKNMMLLILRKLFAGAGFKPALSIGRVKFIRRVFGGDHLCENQKHYKLPHENFLIQIYQYNPNIFQIVSTMSHVSCRRKTVSAPLETWDMRP